MEPTPHSQLEVIYRQLGRSTGFRGFTPGFLASIALVSTTATVAFGALGGSWSLRTTAVAWAVLGVVIAGGVIVGILIPALRASSNIRRAAAQATGIQMAFPLGAGFAVTIAVLVEHPTAVTLLPAIWLMLFGLGVAALSGLVRERVELAAVFYIAAAVIAYLIGPATPWAFSAAVGVPFAVGHALTAWLLRSRRQQE